MKEVDWGADFTIFGEEDGKNVGASFCLESTNEKTQISKSSGKSLFKR